MTIFSKVALQLLKVCEVTNGRWNRPTEVVAIEIPKDRLRGLIRPMQRKEFFRGIAKRENHSE